MAFTEAGSWGSLHEHEKGSSGAHDCRYYTNQPAPTQWVAVGVTTSPPMTGDGEHRLLVGTGRTEAAAIRMLRRRCGWSHPD